MKTTVSKVEKNRVKVAVEVEVEQLNEAIVYAYKQLSNKVKISGFRKGKIPPQIIDRTLGREYVLKEAVDEYMPRFYLEAVHDTKIKPVDRPQVEVKQLEDGKPFLFDFNVTVEPEVTLRKYKNYELVDMKTDVSDEEVDEQARNMAIRFSRLEVSGNETVEEGSFPVVDVEAMLDSDRLDELCASDYVFEVGKGAILPEIENAVLKAKRGEQREARIILTEGYPVEALRGKEVLLRISIKEIKERILPEINDEFAKSVGGFESLNDMKDFFKNQIEGYKKSKRDELLRDQALDQLVENCQIDIPEVMVEDRVTGWLDGLDESLSKRKMDRESYLKSIGKTEEELSEEYKKAAVIEIKQELCLEKIAELENLEVSDEEVQNRAREIADSIKKDSEKIYNYYSKGIGAANIRLSMLRKKALDFIIENAKLKEKVEEDGTKRKVKNKK
ncbi:MAG: trigger factor [Actinobacteria bacterium]|nr:trigger factor [Actinomycetota bacterium]